MKSCSVSETASMQVSHLKKHYSYFESLTCIHAVFDNAATFHPRKRLSKFQLASSAYNGETLYLAQETVTAKLNFIFEWSHRITIKTTQVKMSADAMGLCIFSCESSYACS